MHGVRWFLSGFICGVGFLVSGALALHSLQPHPVADWSSSTVPASYALPIATPAPPVDAVSVPTPMPRISHFRTRFLYRVYCEAAEKPLDSDFWEVPLSVPACARPFYLEVDPAVIRSHNIDACMPACANPFHPAPSVGVAHQLITHFG